MRWIEGTEPVRLGTRGDERAAMNLIRNLLSRVAVSTRAAGMCVINGSVAVLTLVSTKNVNLFI